ncbi:MAG TPA: ABC transporter permease [Fimbriimonadaceae bacterium]|nr:ABC transporter permease [Fimbriimonadaceae bacterium]
MKKPRPILLWLGVGYLALLLIVAIVVPMLRDPVATVQPQLVKDPLSGQMTMHTTFLPISGRHWLGTDQGGHDEFARIAKGAQNSLIIGLVVELIVLVVGVLMAVLGTFAPKWLAFPLMRLTDAMFAFPDILLAILLIGIMRDLRLPPGILADLLTGGYLSVIVALSITSWPGLTRIVRGQLASLKDREFVVAAKANGASTTYIILKHILPQLWGILLAISMVDLAGVILAESTLSFIGIGVQPPNPSWGNMIDKARQDMNSHPALLLWPCIILSLTIFALNFVGDGLSALTDPKSK